MREEVESFDSRDVIVFKEKLNVTSLGGGIAREINDCFGFNAV